jgi:azurin
VNNVPAVSVKTGGLFDKELKQGLRIDKETDGMTAVKSGTIERFTRGIYNLVAEVGGDNNLSASLDADKVIVLKTIPNKMEYDLKTLEVEAGQTVAIIFENVDFMQHNLLIAKPGTLETVGAAADKMAADANGAEKNYIPDVPELLYSTRLVNPGEKVVLTFTAPSEPGDYPYLCTFPGHWRIMNGILKVTSGKSAD